MVFVFLEGYAAGAPSYTTCADANGQHAEGAVGMEHSSSAFCVLLISAYRALRPPGEGCDPYLRPLNPC